MSTRAAHRARLAAGWLLAGALAAMLCAGTAIAGTAGAGTLGTRTTDAGVTGAGTASAGVLVAPGRPGADVPTFDAVRRGWRSSEGWLLDRHGEPLHRVRVDASVRRLDWIALEDVSPALRAAIVVSEDRRFWAHAGVDWPAVAAASFRNLVDTRTRGASTLTMQLAGLLDATLARGTQGRSWTQKVDQAWTATRLERGWRKDQIFEAYLNLVPWRGELVGVDAVSRTLFGKHPSGLDARESAVLAALLRAPNAGADVVARRACGVLADLRPEQAGECASLEGFVRLALARRGGDVDARQLGAPQLAPHLARRLVRQPGERVASTLDARLQRVASASLRTQLAALAQHNVEDGAVIVLDNASGEVLAWVGSSGPLSSAAAVDGVTALRQAGSTLKPFVYGLAIESRLLTAASVLDDSPVDLATASGLYIPRNYDHAFKGPVSLRTALASSLNVPAVRTLVMVTPDALVERLRALGVDALAQSGDFYGYSLALGSADLSLLALANAYRALANGGLASATSVVPSRPAPAPRRVLDAGAAFVIADVLADRNARAPTFGTENVLAARSWAAVKTGTSKDMRDNWCIGFTDRYTVGVWVGNFSGAPMWDVSGTTGAAPVWAEIVGWLHRGSPSRPPAPPPGVVAARVAFDDGLEPARNEWFLRGTELAQVRRVDPQQAPLALVAPLDRSLYALDPDIPAGNQRITFEARGAQAAHAHWRLDGRVLGRGAQLRWAPMPGRHVLELVREGQIVERVHFEVRGATLKAAARAAPARDSPACPPRLCSPIGGNTS